MGRVPIKYKGYIMILGLDWDDTVTTYTKGLSKLAECAYAIHIITLNPDVTESIARKILNVRIQVPITVHIMSSQVYDTTKYDNGIGAWKAKVADANWVDLMIDDMQEVVDECLKIGIPAIQVKAR